MITLPTPDWGEMFFIGIATAISTASVTLARRNIFARRHHQIKFAK